MQSDNVIKVNDMHIGQNKRKLLFILHTSKTHGKNDKPQTVKITSSDRKSQLQQKNVIKFQLCPFQMLRSYIQRRKKAINKFEQFFVFSDRSPVKTDQVRRILKQSLI